MDSDENVASVTEIKDSQPQNEIDDALICKICSGTYTSPRLLSCLHVFCQDCLNGHLNDIITCPKCLQETKVGHCGPASLPRDFIMMNMVGTAEVESETLLCSNCPSKMLAVAFCHDCAEFLCDVCNKSHQSVQSLEEHKVMSLSEGCGSPEPECDSHPNEKLSFYCNKCELPACKECVSEQHQDHDISVCSAELMNQQKASLNKLLQEAEMTCTDLRGVSTSLNRTDIKLQQRYFEAKSRLLDRFETCIDNLARCKRDGLQELEDLRTEQEIHLADIRKQTEGRNKKVEIACKFMSQLMNHENTVEFLYLMNVVKSQLKNILMEPKPIIDENLNVDFESTISAFKNAVKENLRKQQTTVLLHWGTAQGQAAILSDEMTMEITDEFPLSVFGNSSSSYPGLKRTATTTDTDSLSASSPPQRRRRSENTEVKDSHDCQVLFDASNEVPTQELKVFRQLGKANWTEGGFASPCDFCIGWEGDIVVADTDHNRVLVFNNAGDLKFKFGENGHEFGRLHRPVKITALPKSGNLVVGDIIFKNLHTRLQLFTKDGSHIKRINAGINKLSCLTSTARDEIVAADSYSKKVLVFTERCKVLLEFCYKPYVNFPKDIKFWDGEFYLGNSRDQAVVVFGSDGTLKRQFGQFSTEKYFTTGIEVTKSGEIFVGYQDRKTRSLSIKTFNTEGKEQACYKCAQLQKPELGKLNRLRVTEEGCVLTLAENRNTLYFLKKI